MPDFSNSKNFLYNSPIYTDGDVHIGDIYHIQGELRTVPFELNTLPYVAKESVIGRDQDLIQVKASLQTSDRVVLVNGIGGIGKTTLTKYFIANFRKGYNYIAWINNTSNIKEAFTNDVALIDSLHLRQDIESLPKNEQWIDQAFSLILNRMRQLGGNRNQQHNLLIIDNAGEDIEHTQILDQIALRPNWKVLVTSRERLLGFTEYELGFLSKEDAKRLFYLHYQRERDDTLVEEILELIGYHTLTIELLAKTCQTHPSLNLSTLLDSLYKEGISISKAVKVSMENYEKVNTRISINKCLELAFDLGEFSKYTTELYVLLQFSILPSGNFSFELIKELFGTKYSVNNEKESLIDNLNFLAAKGWLRKTAIGYESHPVLMEVVIKKEKPPFFTFLYLITNLSTKLKEINRRYSIEILKYIPLGQSILDKILEVQQPLCILANNLFEAYRCAGFTRIAFYKRLDFLQNAINKFQEEENCLNLVVYFSNLSTSYKEMYNLEGGNKYLNEGLSYLLNAIDTLDYIQKEDIEKRRIYATMLDNLTTYYQELQRFEDAIDTAMKSMKYKSIHFINDDFLVCNSLNNLANIYIILKEFHKAEENLVLALNILLQSKQEKQKLLPIIFSNLSSVYLRLGNMDKADKYQVQALLEFQNGNFIPSVEWALCLEKITILSEIKEDHNTAIYYCEKAIVFFEFTTGSDSIHTLRVKDMLTYLENQLVK